MNWSQFGLTGGLALALLSVIGYLLNSNRQDRAQHREVVTDLRQTIKENDKAASERLDQTEKRSEAAIARLEKRVDDLEREVQDERSLRLKAEADTAAVQIQLAEAHYRLSRATGGG